VQVGRWPQSDFVALHRPQARTVPLRCTPGRCSRVFFAEGGSGRLALLGAGWSCVRESLEQGAGLGGRFLTRAIQPQTAIHTRNASQRASSTIMPARKSLPAVGPNRGAGGGVAASCGARPGATSFRVLSVVCLRRAIERPRFPISNLRSQISNLKSQMPKPNDQIPMTNDQSPMTKSQ